MLPYVMYDRADADVDEIALTSYQCYRKNKEHLGEYELFICNVRSLQKKVM